MESLFRYVAVPSPCGYLPDQRWSLEYEYVGAMTQAEYLRRLVDGWRRFGCMMFRPACPSCRACRSLRVTADRFRPDRSQRRAWRTNAGDVELRVGKPSVTRAKLALYDRYHEFQAVHKGWPEHPAKDAASYADSFVRHPFPVEEWSYYLGGRLVGVGYVDVMHDDRAVARLETMPQQARSETMPQQDTMPQQGVMHGDNAAAGSEAVPRPRPRGEGGLSAIYFFYDPEERQRSLGTYNVLRVIDAAHRRGLPFAYLGYYVEGNAGMEYKTRFVPNQLRGEDGVWRDFRD